MTEGLVVAGVLGMRLFIPLLILRYPLPGIVASMLADAVDGALFDNFTDLSLENYQHYDKSLDIYYLAIAYVSCLRNWTNPAALRVARILWYLRLAGVALFAVTDARIVLFLFPATFEYFFIFYQAFALRWHPERLDPRHLIAVTAISWALKLPQEYWLHVAEGSTTEWLKVSVFGLDPDSSRLDILAENPWLVPAAALFLLAVATAAWLLLRLAPPATGGSALMPIASARAKSSCRENREWRSPSSRLCWQKRQSWWDWLLSSSRAFFPASTPGHLNCLRQ